MHQAVHGEPQPPQRTEASAGSNRPNEHVRSRTVNTPNSLDGDRKKAPKQTEKTVETDSDHRTIPSRSRPSSRMSITILPIKRNIKEWSDLTMFRHVRPLGKQPRILKQHKHVLRECTSPPPPPTQKHQKTLHLSFNPPPLALLQHPRGSIPGGPTSTHPAMCNSRSVSVGGKFWASPSNSSDGTTKNGSLQNLQPSPILRMSSETTPCSCIFCTKEGGQSMWANVEQFRWKCLKTAAGSPRTILQFLHLQIPEFLKIHPPPHHLQAAPLRRHPIAPRSPRCPMRQDLHQATSTERLASVSFPQPTKSK